MIKEVKFITSGTDHSHYPNDGKNEYLFLGRSNVGKSSLINFLVGRKALARTSQTPGKTATLNYYLVNDDFYIVDSPGYGYAKRSKKEIEQFGNMLESYITDREELKKVILLVDYKVGPTKDDLLMLEYLKHFNIDLIIAATKTDKLNQKERSQSQKRFQTYFYNYKVVLTSAEKKIGHQPLLDAIFGG